MAMWNGQRIVYFPKSPVEGYPGWERIDCGCCGGLAWGSESPTKCGECKGSGFYVRHIKSGARALYPGGPFIGRETMEGVKDEQRD